MNWWNKLAKLISLIIIPSILLIKIEKLFVHKKHNNSHLQTNQNSCHKLFQLFVVKVVSKVKGNVFNLIFASVLMAGPENLVIYQPHQHPQPQPQLQQQLQPQPRQQQPQQQPQLQPQPQQLIVNVLGMENVLGMDIVTLQQEFVLV